MMKRFLLTVLLLALLAGCAISPSSGSEDFSSPAESIPETILQPEAVSLPDEDPPEPFIGPYHRLPGLSVPDLMAGKVEVRDRVRSNAYVFTQLNEIERIMDILATLVVVDEPLVEQSSDPQSDGWLSVLVFGLEADTKPVYTIHLDPFSVETAEGDSGAYRTANLDQVVEVLLQEAADMAAEDMSTSPDEGAIITPNPGLSADVPPQPDGQSPIPTDETPEGLTYQSGKVFLTRIFIDGTSQTVEVSDEDTVRQILVYVDSMRESDYNEENTPPGRGQIIHVEVHRDNTMFSYVFSSEIKDGNPLGKDLQDPQGRWYIVDEGAFDYLSALLPDSR